MIKKIRHVLGISGGKDSTALAIYLKNLYPQIDMEYYFCDTGKELDETYGLINKLENFLGKKIEYLRGANVEMPFDHFMKLNGNWLPSSPNRWCTSKMKLEPFEKFIGNDLAISYVGIRGDEDRDGYVSSKPNIQTIFPFRRNIWSNEMIKNLLNNDNINFIVDTYSTITEQRDKLLQILQIVKEPLSPRFSQTTKLNALLSLDITLFNKVMFLYLHTINAVVGQLDNFPLVDNEDNLDKEAIFDILLKSGVGIPEYYKALEYEVNGEKGIYNRTRSGCFFCFFQQKIEWVWLYEQHPDKFWASVAYEKEGYTWIQGESLLDLIKPERIQKIKEEHLKRTNLKLKRTKSSLLVDVFENDEELGCVSCFV